MCNSKALTEHEPQLEWPLRWTDPPSAGSFQCSAGGEAKTIDKFQTMQIHFTTFRTSDFMLQILILLSARDSTSFRLKQKIFQRVSNRAKDTTCIEGSLCFSPVFGLGKKIKHQTMHMSKRIGGLQYCLQIVTDGGATKKKKTEKKLFKLN